LTHAFLSLVTVGLGHGVYRKLYTLMGVNTQKSLRTTDIEYKCIMVTVYCKDTWLSTSLLKQKKIIICNV